MRRETRPALLECASSPRDASVSEDGNACIQFEVERQARRAPDAIAVAMGDRRMTYRELDARANQLARHLIRRGVGPEVRVGVCVERSLAMVVALLGVLKAGGAYVPLDPDHPDQRQAFMLADADVLLLITQAHIEAQHPGLWHDVLRLDSDWGTISKESDRAPRSRHQPENLAYVIYTSGSTGKPKGVAIEHRGLSNLVAWHNEQFSQNPSDRVGQLSALAFDGSVWEIWPCLAAGASLHLVSRESRASPEHLQAWLISEGITLCFLTTALGEYVMSLPWPREVALRTLLTGGETMHKPPPPGLPFEVVNNYGPTENTAITTCEPLSRGIDPAIAPPIGRAISNATVHILDAQLRPVPTGEPGELCIGGASLARGYHDRPELTAERFVPDPVGKTPGARLYRSGDLARELPDGRIEFIQRIDRQVKIRGFRIELGEIESVMGAHPAVQHCAVRARSHAGEAREHRLVAYLVWNPDAQCTTAMLREHLAKTLLSHMIPSTFVALDAMPLTPNFKVDDAALPEPEDTRPELSVAYLAPRNETERVLKEIWVEVLSLQNVGVNDNFLDLGGHSLLATQIVARARDALHVELPLRWFVDHPTVAESAAIIDDRSSALQGRALPPIVPTSRELEPPLSFAQERIWFLQELYPEITAYHFEATIALCGALNVAALERSLGEIIRRHEIFRTSFHARDGRPVQVIHEPFPVQLTPIDLMALCEAEQREEVQRMTRDTFLAPFDLTQLPLIRWELLRLGAEEHLLIQAEHHLVHDGWSFNVFLGELKALYNAFASNAPSPLPEPTIQFRDFACWQREWMQGEAAEEQLQYWKERLAGASALLELPSDRPRPAVQRFKGESRALDLPLDTCEGLRSIARQEGTSLYMVMLAGFLILLHRYSGATDICVGAGVANRQLREVEDVIGMVLNTVALRNDLSGNPSYRDLLERVRAVCAGAYAHQDVPFDSVVEAVQPERSLSHSPLYQVMFSFHDSPLEDMTLDGLETTLNEGLSFESSKFDLNVSVIPRSEQRVGERSNERDRRVTLLWEHNSDLFDSETSLRMYRAFRELLADIVADPNRRISDLSILSAKERKQVIEKWNRTRVTYPRDARIQDLFEEQVARNPHAIALVSRDGELSYGELNARANRLARHLAKHGVGPETLVGICLERSLETVVGLLAILKAGGVYVPLDTNYPKERLAFMLEDTGLPVLVTDSTILYELPEHLARVICLDVDRDAIARESDANLEVETSGENLAYVIYTSGSTGIPKGVEVPHRGVLRLLCSVDYVQLDEHQVVAQLAPTSFDASSFEIWGPLLHGARGVVFPECVPTTASLRGWIAEHGITTLWLTASLFNAVIDEEPSTLAPIRQLLIGGEALSVSHVLRAYEHLPETKIINGYGPTESTTFTCSHAIPRGLTPDTKSVPIGQPIANTEVYVLDDQMMPVPIGVPGELHIGGDGLARGYLERAGLTAEAFVPHPFSSRPGERLYKTGDRVRALPDGAIEFLGRVDHQVKVRGFRIELGEIEATLRRHPEVTEVVAVVREDVPGDKRLAAYVVGAPPPSAELRVYLQQKLPGHMIPQSFVTLERLPLNPNGKVDRDALPAPDSERADRDTLYVAPRTSLERKVARIWSEILDIEQVGVNDDFFELGGHSLLATQIVSRIRDALDVDLPVRRLFDAPSVAAMATAIETTGRDQSTPKPPAMTSVSREAHRRKSSSIGRPLRTKPHVEPKTPSDREHTKHPTTRSSKDS